MADNSALRRQRDRSRHDRGRAALFETLVRACLVIVGQELLDHRFQVAGAEDQHVVEQLPAGGKNEPLRDRVGVSLQLQMVLTVRKGSLSPIPSTR